MAKSQKKHKPSIIKGIGYALCIALILFGGWYACQAAKKQHAVYSQQCESYSLFDSLMRVRTVEGLTEELLHYPGFVVSFNSEYKQPNWVAWELTADEVTANNATRKDADFTPDTKVNGCPTLLDYKNSGFDRGHMCPAGDMKWDAEAMRACFYLTNICPQARVLNNGSWNKLEEKCRNWAQRDSALVIICGPVLTDTLTRTIGPSRVPVPERFFKVVIAPYAKPMRAIGFVMPNGAVPGGTHQSAVSIDEVESITGFDFFAVLPDSLENQIESECNFPLWNQR